MEDMHYTVVACLLYCSITYVICEDNVFSQGAEDFLDNRADQIEASAESRPPIRKSGRDDSAVDLEVILNPGPMIAPDIIIRNFVDPKMTVDKMMGVMINNGQEDIGHGENGIDSPESDNYQDATSDSENEVEIEDSYHNDRPFETEWEDTYPSQLNSVSQLKTFKNSDPCRMKFNGTSGRFSLNFTQDCLILVTTPEKKSRVVLNCSPIVLGNCSTNRDTLTVNFKGDMRFGRNSYVYCGRNAQIRATSLKKRISIKIRKAPEEYHDQIAKCVFTTRERRDLSPSLLDIHSSTLLGSFVPSNSNCGKLGRNAKIVGGKLAEPGLFPWVAQLDITRTDGTQTACTGSLISPHYVLTAAHCLKNAESISVFMGGTDRHDFTGSEIIIQAEKYILHRKWSPKTLRSDIALVKLTEPVKYTEDVSPICLPKGKLRTESLDGRKGVAVGWGRIESKKKAPRRLYRVRLPFLDDNSCRRHYRRFFVPKLMVCTDSNEDAAICYGDSGGPLMYKRNERVHQIGVASFSLSKTCGASPDVFTHVGEYTDWIESRINQEEEDE